MDCKDGEEEWIERMMDRGEFMGLIGTRWIERMMDRDEFMGLIGTRWIERMKEKK